MCNYTCAAACIVSSNHVNIKECHLKRVTKKRARVRASTFRQKPAKMSERLTYPSESDSSVVNWSDDDALPECLPYCSTPRTRLRDYKTKDGLSAASCDESSVVDWSPKHQSPTGLSFSESVVMWDSWTDAVVEDTTCMSTSVVSWSTPDGAEPPSKRTRREKTTAASADEGHGRQAQLRRKRITFSDNVESEGRSELEANEAHGDDSTTSNSASEDSFCKTK